MIFDFFTARLQRKKYETQTVMSMGFADFFHKIFTRPLFPSVAAALRRTNTTGADGGTLAPGNSLN